MNARELATALALGLVLATAASAQNYPARAVRIMVGYPPGGGVDVAARIVAQGLSEVWGNQNAIVDNRPGAAGGIGTELTAKAAPDGYTLMLCQIASHAITPARAKSLPYDHIKDFSFVSMVGATPNVIRRSSSGFSRLTGRGSNKNWRRSAAASSPPPATAISSRFPTRSTPPAGPSASRSPTATTPSARPPAHRSPSV